MIIKIQIGNGRELEEKSKVDDSYSQCTFPNRQIIEVFTRLNGLQFLFF